MVRIESNYKSKEGGVDVVTNVDVKGIGTYLKECLGVVDGIVKMLDERDELVAMVFVITATALFDEYMRDKKKEVETETPPSEVLS